MAISSSYSLKNLHQFYENIDRQISSNLEKYGTRTLQYGFAVVFIWFGLLKPLGKSPAEELVIATTDWAFPSDIFVPLLGWWEVLIGVTFLFKKTHRIAIFLLALQMPGTFLPLIVVPDVCFTSVPFGLTLEGQYIIKNLIIIAGAMVIGGKVRDEENN
ncbi:MAG: hypothetical protein ACXAC2_25405 [Candidatus Kariarchaeaceae archaeon]|jgi:uncharacterized membrane protein YkgB